MMKGSTMSPRKPLALAVALGTAAAALVAPPVVHAQVEPVAKTVSVSQNCAANIALWSADRYLFKGNSSQGIEVQYPASVAPGEVFTVFAQPGPMTTLDDEEIGRINYSFTLPTNAQILDVEYAGGDYGITIPTGSWSMRVERANANGVPNPNGPLVKIWGGASINFGGDQNTGTANLGGEWSAGLTVAGNTGFRLPKVAVRMRAPQAGTGTTIGLDAFSKGTAGAAGSTANTFQFMEISKNGLGTRWGTDNVFCKANYPGSLTATTVTGDPVEMATSDTALTSGDITVEGGKSAAFVAKVTAPNALAADLSNDDVTFIRTDTGATLGTAKPDPVTGIATLNYTGFGAMSIGTPDYVVPVAAVYSGYDNWISPSQSTTSLITVTPKVYNLVRQTVTIPSITRGSQTAAGAIPVTVNVNVTRAGNAALPLQVQLYKDGVPFNAPRAVTSGTMTFADTLERQTETRIVHYTAKIVEYITGNDKYVGETAFSSDVIVQGTNPSTAHPDFADGSSQFSSIFVDQDRFLEIMAGAFTNAGLGSLTAII